MSTLDIQATDDDIKTYIMKQLEESEVRPKDRAVCFELVKDVG